MVIENWFLMGTQSLFLMPKTWSIASSVDLFGKKIAEFPVRDDESLIMIDGSPDNDELLFQTESFTEPLGLFRYSTKTKIRTRWSRATSPLNGANYAHLRVWYTSKDRTSIPMYLVGRRDVLER